MPVKEIQPGELEEFDDPGGMPGATIGPGQAHRPALRMGEFKDESAEPFRGLGGAGRRWLVKNSGGKPEGAMKWVEGFKNEDGSQRYETAIIPRSFGADFNFGVRRRGTGEEWQVLDPSPDRWSDFLLDMGDIAYDAAQSVVVGAATTAGGFAGGVPGAATGGGLAYLATEAPRQLIGAVAGLPDSFQPASMALGTTATALTGALMSPPVSKAVGGAVNAAVQWGGRKLRDIGAKAIGVDAVHGVSPGNILQEAIDYTSARSPLSPRILSARSKPQPRQLPSFVMSGAEIYRKLKAIDARGVPGRAVVRGLVDDADQNGVTINAQPVLDRLRSLRFAQKGERAVTKTGRVITESEYSAEKAALRTANRDVQRTVTPRNPETGVPGTPRISDYSVDETIEGASRETFGRRAMDVTTTKTTMETLYGPQHDEARRLLGKYPGLSAKLDEAMTQIRIILEDLPEHAIPAGRGVELKEAIRGIAQDYGAFVKANVGKEASKVARSVFTDAERALREEIEASMTKAGYNTFVPAMRQWEYQLRKLGNVRAAYGLGLPNDMGIARAEAAVGALFGKSNESRWLALRSAERVLGFKPGELTQKAWQSHVGYAVRQGAGGKIAVMPKMTDEGMKFTLFQRLNIAPAVTGAVKHAPGLYRQLSTMAAHTSTVAQRTVPAAVSVAVSEDSRKRGPLVLE